MKIDSTVNRYQKCKERADEHVYSSDFVKIEVDEKFITFRMNKNDLFQIKCRVSLPQPIHNEANKWGKVYPHR